MPPSSEKLREIESVDNLMSLDDENEICRVRVMPKSDVERDVFAAMIHDAVVAAGRAVVGAATGAAGRVAAAAAGTAGGHDVDRAQHVPSRRAVHVTVEPDVVHPVLEIAVIQQGNRSRCGPRPRRDFGRFRICMTLSPMAMPSISLMSPAACC